jgi:beta-glucosidase
MIRRCAIALLVVASSAPLYAQAGNAPPNQRRAVVSRMAPILERHGLRFKDLNRNGVLDPYEDWRLSPSARSRDLVSRMTLEEKAGMMMHGTAPSAGPPGIPGAGSAYDTAAIGKVIRDAHVNTFITRLSGDPRSIAAQNNSLQEMAERTRLGIPVTVSTDPRNHFQYVAGASVQSGGFSKWPEALGFGALRDAALVRRFADIARQEYRSVGIQETLSPQADIATEPRWSRINGTFGEDPDLTRDLVKAYVEGFQHGASGVDSAGVLAVVKHWVGYGAQKNGFDSHSSYGRFASFSGGLDAHIKPFLGAFAAHVGGVMPTYSILEGATIDGRPLEQVGAGFNRQLLTDLLRKRYGFQGIILTDWLITNDCPDVCRNGFPAGQRPTFAAVAMSWGVEDLPKVDRFAKAVNAGVDQFGGTEESQFLVQAVRSGKITERRINESVNRIAIQKFRQGLFENPYVDTAEAGRFVGNPRFQAEATVAQRRSLVLLENRNGILPLAARDKRVFLHGIDSATAARYGFNVVRDLTRAEIAIVRTTAPFQTLHPNYVFGAMQHEGDLGFLNGNPEFEEIKRITAAVPTIVTVYLDRPAILTELKDRASALVGNFGVSDAALLDVLTGAARPEGRLPFELPSSMAEVEAQRSDVPHDTAHPLYPIGYGRRYSVAGDLKGFAAGR